MKKVKSEYQSCAYCVHRKECWNSEAYADEWRGTGKKPYPSDVKCEVRFNYDKTKGLS